MQPGLPPPRTGAGHAILTVTFSTGAGDGRVYSRSPCFRLCADGTLRAGDNAIAASRVPGGWRVGRQVFRDFDCGGPVMLIVRSQQPARSEGYGPCRCVRAVNGQLFADDVGLRIYLPTAEAAGGTPWHEALLVPATA